MTAAYTSLVVALAVSFLIDTLCDVSDSTILWVGRGRALETQFSNTTYRQDNEVATRLER